MGSTTVAASAKAGLANGRHLTVQLHEVGQLARAGVGQLEVHRHRVAADAEEHALAQGEQPAATPRQADADRHDGDAEVLGEQVQPEVAEHQRRHREQDDRGEGEPGDRARR